MITHHFCKITATNLEANNVSEYGYSEKKKVIWRMKKKVEISFCRGQINEPLNNRSNVFALKDVSDLKTHFVLR